MRAERTLDEVADAIVRLPLDERANLSHVDLINRSGYMARRGQVSVGDLYRRLAPEPALVEAWQGWVDDNRGYPAWYFRPIGGGRFEVGHLDRRLNTTKRHVFDEYARACAEYVHREIEDLANAAEIWRRPWRLIREVFEWFMDGRKR